MKKIDFLPIMLTIIILTGCKTGMLISETKVPYSKICGSNSKYKCKATGFGSNLPISRIYEKERPSGEGKTDDSNPFHLGRAADLNAENNTIKALVLTDSDYTIDTTKIDYDLKSENISKLLIELNSSLKKENIDLDLAAQIRNDFEKQLKNNLVIEAYIYTFTIKQRVQDQLRDAADGRPTEERYERAVQTLKTNKMPLIREVIVIEEICNFTESRNLANVLEPVLKGTLGDNNPQVNILINATISKERSSEFTSNYKRKSIYSYGFLNDRWMMN